MKRIFEAFACLIAGGLLVFLPMFMLLGNARADYEAQRSELDETRAQVVDLENERVVVYCRGVIDQFLAGIDDPEIVARNDQVCLEIMAEGTPPGFRGP